MTRTLLTPPDAYSAAVADAIAAAKERWQRACWDGSGAAEVQRLYEVYRDLVIARVAAVTGRGPAVQPAA